MTEITWKDLKERELKALHQADYSPSKTIEVSPRLYKMLNEKGLVSDTALAVGRRYASGLTPLALHLLEMQERDHDRESSDPFTRLSAQFEDLADMYRSELSLRQAAEVEVERLKATIGKIWDAEEDGYGCCVYCNAESMPYDENGQPLSRGDEYEAAKAVEYHVDNHQEWCPITIIRVMRQTNESKEVSDKAEVERLREALLEVQGYGWTGLIPDTFRPELIMETQKRQAAFDAYMRNCCGRIAADALKGDAK